MPTPIETYFPGLTSLQRDQFRALPELYRDWNAKINVVSRQDIAHLEERHILHSLSIAKAITFAPGTRVLDAGTGGGFPGIPLAIIFPETRFVLTDSIGKKIRVVADIAAALSLDNVTAVQSRVEEVAGTFDFVTGRAVTAVQGMLSMIRGKISRSSVNSLPNGLLYLKGGDIGEELKATGRQVSVFDLSDWFSEPFFETKKLIHIPLA